MAMIIADIFYYYSDYLLLLCIQCPKVLTTRDAIPHFKLHISSNESQFKDWISQISHLDIQTITKSIDLIRQNEPVTPFPGLTVKEGLACQWDGCKMLFFTSESITRHLSRDHGQSKRGSNEWIQNCHLQSLHLQKHLFLVQASSAALPAQPSPQTQSQPAISTTPSTTPSTSQSQPAPQQWVQGILNDYQARVQAVEENSGSIKVYYSKAEWSTFHSTVGTANFWQGRDVGLVGPLLGDNLLKQRAILQLGLFYLFRKAEIRVPFLPRQSRADLRSYDLQNLTFREFRTVQQQATREKYITVMARFLQFLLATYQYQVLLFFLTFFSIFSHFSLTFSYFFLFLCLYYYLFYIYLYFYFSLTFLSLSLIFSYFYVNFYYYFYIYIYAYFLLTMILTFLLLFTFFSLFSYFSLTFLSLSLTFSYFFLFLC